jgi:hypothetical protein
MSSCLTQQEQITLSLAQTLIVTSANVGLVASKLTTMLNRMAPNVSSAIGIAGHIGFVNSIAKEILVGIIDIEVTPAMMHAKDRRGTGIEPGPIRPTLTLIAMRARKKASTLNMRRYFLDLSSNIAVEKERPTPIEAEINTIKRENIMEKPSGINISPACSVNIDAEAIANANDIRSMTKL